MHEQIGPHFNILKFCNTFQKKDSKDRKDSKDSKECMLPRIARIACLPLLLVSLKAAPAVRTQVPAAAAPISRTCILVPHIEKSTVRKQHTSFYCAFF